MTWAEDKRKHLRLGSFLEGAFQTADDQIMGLVMLTDFTKAGFRASFNRHLDADKLIKIELWIPGSIIPVFVTCSVIWIKKSTQDWTYEFDAGIKIWEIPPEDRERLLDYVYESWRRQRKNE